MDRIGGTIALFITGIISVATIAVLVRSSSNTAGVIKAGGSAFSTVLGTAMDSGSSGGLSTTSLSTGLSGFSYS